MELSIDTAGPVAGVALTDRGALLADLSWRSRAGHAAELLPAIESVLIRTGADRADLRAVFVCQGPGGYAGLRVGVSTAMGLAFALGLDALGVNRLEADAWMHAAYPGPILPIHAAGRGDLAWTVYSAAGGWHAAMPARISLPTSLLAEAPQGALLCGEVDDTLAEAARQQRPDLHVFSGPAHHRRALTIASLAWSRYAAGARDDPAALEPIYLREPNITKKAER